MAHTRNFVLINTGGVSNLQIGNNSTMTIIEDGNSRSYFNDEYKRQNTEKCNEKEKTKVENENLSDDEILLIKGRESKYSSTNRRPLNFSTYSRSPRGSHCFIYDSDAQHGDLNNEKNDNVTEVENQKKDKETEKEINVTFISTAPGLREKSTVAIKLSMNACEIEASLRRYTGRSDITLYTIIKHSGEHIYRSDMDEEKPIHTYGIQNGDVFYVM